MSRRREVHLDACGDLKQTSAPGLVIARIGQKHLHELLNTLCWLDIADKLQYIEIFLHVDTVDPPFSAQFAQKSLPLWLIRRTVTREECSSLPNDMPIYYTGI